VEAAEGSEDVAGLTAAGTEASAAEDFEGVVVAAMVTAMVVDTAVEGIEEETDTEEGAADTETEAEIATNSLQQNEQPPSQREDRFAIPPFPKENTAVFVRRASYANALRFSLLVPRRATCSF